MTNKGCARWQIIDGNFDSDRLIEFLGLLVKDAGKKVFLILDDLRVHHGKLVKAWLEENKEKLRAAANEHMTMLEKNPQRVASYFQDPRVKYAA